MDNKAFSHDRNDDNFYFRTRNQDGSSIFTITSAGTYGNQNRNSIGFNNATRAAERSAK